MLADDWRKVVGDGIQNISVHLAGLMFAGLAVWLQSSLSAYFDVRPTYLGHIYVGCPGNRPWAYPTLSSSIQLGQFLAT